MFGALGKSLASWRTEHGFGVLCGIDPHGEHFEVLPSAAGVPKHQRVLPWSGRSESELRLHLRQSGRQDSEVAEAIEIAREWATTTTIIIDRAVSN